MLDLKEQILGSKGFSNDLVLSNNDLSIFREEVNQQWLGVIENSYPELIDEAREMGIENYHLLTDRLNHKKLWPKQNRVLPQLSVNKIKALDFLKIIHSEFGAFSISDIYDTHQHHGMEEVYWRLVRPGVNDDVGPLHKDKWFHGAFNSGYGMFAENLTTIKLWIPLFCEPGKSGLLIAAGSHLREWKYHIEIENDVPRPKPDEDLSDANAVLIPTAPGNVLIFNEGILHGGALNKGTQTRVSAEITLVLEKSILRSKFSLAETDYR